MQQLNQSQSIIRTRNDGNDDDYGGILGDAPDKDVMSDGLHDGERQQQRPGSSFVVTQTVQLIEPQIDEESVLQDQSFQKLIVEIEQPVPADGAIASANLNQGGASSNPKKDAQNSIRGNQITDKNLKPEVDDVAETLGLDQQHAYSSQSLIAVHPQNPKFASTMRYSNASNNINTQSLSLNKAWALPQRVQIKEPEAQRSYGHLVKPKSQLRQAPQYTQLARGGLSPYRKSQAQARVNSTQFGQSPRARSKPTSSRRDQPQQQVHKQASVATLQKTSQKVADTIEQDISQVAAANIQHQLDQMDQQPESLSKSKPQKHHVQDDRYENSDASKLPKQIAEEIKSVQKIQQMQTEQQVQQEEEKVEETPHTKQTPAELLLDQQEVKRFDQRRQSDLISLAETTMPPNQEEIATRDDRASIQSDAEFEIRPDSHIRRHSRDLMKEEEVLLLQEVQLSQHEATVPDDDSQDNSDGEDLGDEGQVFQIDTREQPILKEAATNQQEAPAAHLGGEVDMSAVTTPVIVEVDTEEVDDLLNQEEQERAKSPPSAAPQSEQGIGVAQSREEVVSTSKSHMMQAPELPLDEKLDTGRGQADQVEANSARQSRSNRSRQAKQVVSRSHQSNGSASQQQLLEATQAKTERQANSDNTADADESIKALVVRQATHLVEKAIEHNMIVDHESEQDENHEGSDNENEEQEQHQLEYQRSVKDWSKKPRSKSRKTFMTISEIRKDKDKDKDQEAYKFKHISSAQRKEKMNKLISGLEEDSREYFAGKKLMFENNSKYIQCIRHPFKENAFISVQEVIRCNNEAKDSKFLKLKKVDKIHSDNSNKFFQNTIPWLEPSEITDSFQPEGNEVSQSLDGQSQLLISVWSKGQNNYHCSAPLLISTAGIFKRTINGDAKQVLYTGEESATTAKNIFFFKCQKAANKTINDQFTSLNVLSNNEQQDEQPCHQSYQISPECKLQRLLKSILIDWQQRTCSVPEPALVTLD